MCTCVPATNNVKKKKSGFCMIILLDNLSDFFLFNSLRRPLEAQAHTGRESARVDFGTLSLLVSPLNLCPLF